MEANLHVHMTHFAQYCEGTILIRQPAYTLVDSGLADDTFNYLLTTHLNKTTATEQINHVKTHFAEAGRDYSWWKSPGDEPEHLNELLEHSGFHHSENNTAMYFDLDKRAGNIDVPPELQIIKAGDEKLLQDFALVLANDEKAFEQYFSMIASVHTDDDPIEHYVGYVDDKPVVRGLICFAANVAGLHWLSTAVDERHKGYGKAMQQYRLQRAKDRGYQIAVLQASAEGYPLYKKLGYQECGVYQEFKLPAEY